MQVCSRCELLEAENKKLITHVHKLKQKISYLKESSSFSSHNQNHQKMKPLYEMEAENRNLKLALSKVKELSEKSKVISIPTERKC